MSAKWRFFVIVNYLMTVFYLIILVFAIKAFFNPESGMRTLEGARLITFCLFVVFSNTCFNIYIFHKNMPDKLLSKKLKLIYRVMTGLCTMAFAILLLLFIPDFYSIYTSEEDPSFIYFISLISAVIITNLLTLLMQYYLPGSVEKKNKERISKEIDTIGGRI